MVTKGIIKDFKRYGKIEVVWSERLKKYFQAKFKSPEDWRISFLFETKEEIPDNYRLYIEKRKFTVDRKNEGDSK